MLKLAILKALFKEEFLLNFSLRGFF